ncbi:hypothetical protein RN001_013391 [Aquatica leii]|uniref:Sodefrin-like factor n=1 Tax=Aquatica leii TaxID=1421715 RepID=A0AAN7P2D6_9COLE|nr:hypothetical protein RN001_013391 [Aquatica leii]
MASFRCAIILAVVVLFFFQNCISLKCYDCIGSQCSQNLTNMTKTDCKEKLQCIRIVNPEKEVVIRRGCANETSCDIFAECDMCNEDLCNSSSQIVPLLGIMSFLGISFQCYECELDKCSQNLTTMSKNPCEENRQCFKLVNPETEVVIRRGCAEKGFCDAFAECDMCNEELCNASSQIVPFLETSQGTQRPCPHTDYLCYTIFNPKTGKVYEKGCQSNTFCDVYAYCTTCGNTDLCNNQDELSFTTTPTPCTNKPTTETMIEETEKTVTTTESYTLTDNQTSFHTTDSTDENSTTLLRPLCIIYVTICLVPFLFNYVTNYSNFFN